VFLLCILCLVALSKSEDHSIKGEFESVNVSNKQNRENNICNIIDVSRKICSTNIVCKRKFLLEPSHHSPSSPSGKKDEQFFDYMIKRFLLSERDRHTLDSDFSKKELLLLLPSNQTSLCEMEAGPASKTPAGMTWLALMLVVNICGENVHARYDEHLEKCICMPWKAVLRPRPPCHKFHSTIGIGLLALFAIIFALLSSASDVNFWKFVQIELKQAYPKNYHCNET
jgi:hypothetical protein